MAACFILKWILMVLFTGLTVRGSPARGVVGQNVTLPCKYRVTKQTDITEMCWGRGPCPWSQCSQPVLWADGWRVTGHQSSRYQLEGNLAQGDVSLTIVNVTEADGGVYCCRVETPGLFNDQRNNLDVVIEKAPTDATMIFSSVTPRRLLDSGSEAPQAFDAPTSIHPLQPESLGTGIYIRIGIILSLLIILILALFIFTCLTVRGSPVRGVVGQSVTLPCKYHVTKQTDITEICWGRGPCPWSQCSQPVLWTDGWRVTGRQSSRYQLEGNLTQGDVSLTIVNVTEADGGVYCCRVEIPGLFNDQRNNLGVVIEKAETPTAVPPNYTSERTSVAVNASDRSPTIIAPWPLVVSSEAPQAVPMTLSTSIHQLMQSESLGTELYVGIGIFVVLLTTLVLALLILKRYFRNRQKLKTLESSVSFSNRDQGGIQSALEAEIHAEENIYTMD